MNSNMENEREIENNYALSGKIMLTAIIILFAVIIIMLCLHLLIRQYLLRDRTRQHLRRSRPLRRQPFIFYVDPSAPASLTLAVVSRGLDASVISSLPVFKYSPKTDQAVDCAVCLSEFEDGETGRVLPKCNHSFHIDCIDMWFQSHSTCPLCRAPVEAAPVQATTRQEVTIDMCEPELVLGSSSSDEMNRSGPEFCSSSCSNEKASSSVEIPRRSESDCKSFDVGESSCDSPSSFRSPMSRRVLSLTRILSRERKPSVTPSLDCAADAERGGREETQ